MNTLLLWAMATAIGMSLSGWAGMQAVWSSAAASSVIGISFSITRFFKVADPCDVSKMGTAWLAQQLRMLVWRMLLTLVLAGLVYRLAYPAWGVPFWLNLAAYYQLGLWLHLREIRLGYIPADTSVTQ
ncbi:MAG TPA: hypothetical protein PKA06_07045 [Gemmatales bacterium]|nr:hypothetical protein [Gemmatales bacterium]HMP15957.1 hypothetical protein [Gemmatales bacterium]